MSSPDRFLCGGCWDYDRRSQVRPAHHGRLEPSHLDRFIGFRTLRTAVTAVHVRAVSVLQFVRGGCRNSGHPEGVEARSFMSLIDSVGDHDTGFRCYLAGRRCFSRT